MGGRGGRQRWEVEVGGRGGGGRKRWRWEEEVEVGGRGGRERWRWEEEVEVGGRGGGGMKSGDRIKEGTKRAGNEGEEGLKKR